jgi:hypothetical protein
MSCYINVLNVSYVCFLYLGIEQLKSLTLFNKDAVEDVSVCPSLLSFFFCVCIRYGWCCCHVQVVVMR